MKLKFALMFFLSVSIFSQAQEEKEDKVLYKTGYSLQYAYHETDLQEMLLSSDTIKSNTANRIINQFQTQAIREYDEIIRRFPKSEYYVDALYQKAEALLNMGLDSQAKEVFLKVYSISPYKIKTLLILASLSVDEKDYESAIKYIEERKKAPPRYGCGNEFRSEQMLIESILEKCRNGMSKK